MMLRAIRWSSLIYYAVCVSSLIIFTSQLLAAISALRIEQKQNKTKQRSVSLQLTDRSLRL